MVGFTPGRADTPPGSRPFSRHPPGADTPLGVDITPESRHPPEQTFVGRRHSLGADPPQEDSHWWMARILPECILVYNDA